ncbi:MAG: hypothetical protein WC614_05660 [bacterium]
MRFFHQRQIRFWPSMFRFSFCLFLLLSFIPFAYSQYWEFGKNKVQYKGFDWKVVDTDEFSLVYYPGGEELEKFAHNVITENYERYCKALNHKPKGRVPVIMYNSHNDFEQTNITTEVDESVGGFTEIFKSRVVVPFDGSYEVFRHVLSHELVHAFQFSVLKGDGFTQVLALKVSQIPLWYMEGMAEYFSLGWNAEADMVIRDALYWDKIRPVDRLYEIQGSYLMYKEGQSILNFIVNRYGENKVGEILKKQGIIGNFEGSLEQVLGIDEKELNRLWMQELKTKYWKECAGKLPVPENTRQLTDRDGKYAFNTSPVISPDGSEIAFFSDRDDYESLYLMSAINGEVKAKLIGGGKTEAFESFHIMQGGIGWSPDNQKIVMVAKNAGKDVLYIMNSHSRKITKKIVPDLDRVFSPSFSPDGKKIAIRGVKEGAADIYVIDLKSGDMEQITEDMYDDMTPSWSLDGKYILFSSDRPCEDSVWRYGYYSVFRVGAFDNVVEKMPIDMPRASCVVSPMQVVGDSTGDTCVLFVSNYTGANNLFVFHSRDKKLLQLTDVIGGVFTPSVTKDGKYLTFSLYCKGGWDIYAIKNPTSKGFVADSEKVFSLKYNIINKDTTPDSGKKLGLRITPDWASGGLAYSSSGSSIYAEFLMSDWAGNHQLYLQSNSPDNLLGNFYVSYLYRPHRWDYGIAFAREEYGYYTSSYYEWKKHSETGGAFLAQYPVDKFRRIELDWQGFLTEEEGFHTDGIADSSLGAEWYYITGPSISFVLDNSIWNQTGPYNGERMKISLSSKLPLEDMPGERYSRAYNLYSIDLRRYLRITNNFSFAMRFMNIGIWGRDEISTYITDADYLRTGWGVDLVEGKNLGLFSMEFRYPFIDEVKIAFPLPLILGGIRGGTFVDFGYGKDNFNFKEMKIMQNGELKDLKMSFGTGIRMNLYQFYLKMDCAWSTDLMHSISQPCYYISLSPEF